MISMRFIILCVVVGFQSVAAAVLKPFLAEYSVSISGMPLMGHAQLCLFRLANGNWQLSHKASLLTYRLNETTRFRWRGDQVIPLEYSSLAGHLGVQKRVGAVYDWNNKLLVSNNKQYQWLESLSNKDLDTLSLQLQLQWDLQIERGINRYQIIRNGKREYHVFVHDGDEQFSSASGIIDTVRVKKIKVKQGEKTLEKNAENSNHRVIFMWLAKEWDYLPIKYSYKDEKRLYTAVLSYANLGKRKLFGIIN